MKNLDTITINSTSGYSNEDAVRQYLQDHKAGCHGDDRDYYSNAIAQLDHGVVGDELQLEIDDIVSNGGLVEVDNGTFALFATQKGDKKMKKTIKTWCPVFPGFYNTIFEMNDNDMYEDIAERLNEHGSFTPSTMFNGKLYDYLPLDIAKWEYDYAKDIVDAVHNELDIAGIVDMRMEKLYSPKEYNFSNDSIDIELDVDINVFRESLLKICRMDGFDDYIKGKYTSCSGFISSYSNDAEDWIKLVLDDAWIDDNEHIVGSILQYYLDDAGFDEWGLYDSVEAPYWSEYVTSDVVWDVIESSEWISFMRGAEKELERYIAIMGENSDASRKAIAGSQSAKEKVLFEMLEKAKENE